MQNKTKKGGRFRPPVQSDFPFNIVVTLCILVFLTIMLTMLLTGGTAFVLIQLGIIPLSRPFPPIFFIALISVVVGTVLAGIAAVKVFAPIRELIKATRLVANGDFDISLNEEQNIAEIREMAHNFNRMVRQLRSTELIHSDFIRNVSHEFKTPLSTIEGYATLLQNPSLSDEKRLLYASRIVASTRRLTTLTGNILLLSRLENEEISLSKKPFCLDEQLRQAVLLFETEWNRKGLSLELQLPCVSYCGNEELLFHVWQNLLDNAVKFSEEGATLSVLLEKTPAKITVSVRNTGSVIAEADLARIFEKFYQAEPARSTAGNGLGLSLVRQIVRLHDGSVSVRSSAAEGTCFIVHLPVQSRA